ncbi:class I SAM-dependent methyltransferase [Lacibacterium aquatile]|uniref:Class I SAM-dependent methyltransferase n=1 Tax=Lacibacterium aquatile TaxID=1168082 RepID=A0ABW5DRY6_9PROT
MSVNEQSQAALWDREYRDGRWNFLHAMREVPRYGIVSAYLAQVLKPGSLLDIGCGDGVLMDYLPVTKISRYVGVDLAQEALDRFRGLPVGGELACADLQSYQPQGKFDAILFNEVLFFADDPAAEMARYKKFLTPEGAMVVSLYVKQSGGAARQLAQVEEALAGTEWDLIDSCKLVSNAKGTTWHLFLAR